MQNKSVPSTICTGYSVAEIEVKKNKEPKLVVKHRLTDKQEMVLRFVQEAVNGGKPFPTLQAIAQHIGSKHKNAAAEHLKALERKGYINKRNQRVSSFELSDGQSGDLGDWSNNPKHHSFPLVGTIFAGEPRTAFEVSDQVSFSPDYFGRGELIALQVSGESMSGDSIHDKDIAIVKLQKEWGSSQDILALRVLGDEVTLKRVKVLERLSKVALIPSNPAVPVKEFYAHDVEVIGVFVGLVRRRL